MALIGYDPTRRGDTQTPTLVRKPAVSDLEPTIMPARADLPRMQHSRALRLIPLMGGDQSPIFVAPKSETILGRQIGAGLPVWDCRVSRQHCKIVLTDQAAILIDLHSSSCAGNRAKKH
jgi:hypothetical protein